MMDPEVSINSEEIVMNFTVRPEQIEKLSFQIAEELNPTVIKTEDTESSINADEIKSTSIKTEEFEPIFTNTEEIFSCTVCSYTSTLYLDFKQHKESHTGKLFYDCHLCKDSFENRMDLIVHIRYHKTKKNSRPAFTCDICSATLTTLNSLKNHKLIHTGEKPYKCDVCKTSYRQRNALIRHRSVHDPEKYGKSTNKCTDCPQSIPPTTSCHHKQRQDSHTGTRDVQEDQEYRCLACNKSLKNSATLKTHMKTHTIENLERKRNYRCQFCTKSFYRLEHLNHHMRTHTGERPYKFDFCGKTCLKKSDLDRHKVTHKYKTKPCKFKNNCTVCGKSFRNYYNVKRNISEMQIRPRKLDGEKNMKRKGERRHFECQQCPAAFKGPWQLRRHVRLHTGEKPFACSICGQEFTTKYAVNRHVGRKHKNVKCHMCPEIFENYDKLKKYADQHDISDKKRFKCEMCNISIRNAMTFKRHMEKHEKLSCKICKLDFPANLKVEYEEHMETHWNTKPSCTICGKICDSHKEICLHFMNVHDLPKICLKQD